MAGFEVIVRPAVFPNIRPAPARVLAPEDNPEQDIAVLGGAGGATIELPHTFNVNITKSKPQHEGVRQFNTERVYQMDKAGNINKDNYVDIERLSRIRLDNEEGPTKVLYAEPPPVSNVETLERDVTRKSP